MNFEHRKENRLILIETEKLFLLLLYFFKGSLKEKNRTGYKKNTTNELAN